MICGLYKIVNKINGKYYVGSSNDIHHRWQYHRRLLNENRHDNGRLQKSWNKHGSDNFEFAIIEEVSKEFLLDAEQKYLDICKLNSKSYYNIAYDATSPMKGKIPWNKGKKGLQVSPNKGKKFSEQTREKISKTRIEKGISKGEKNAMFGKSHSKETKEKMKLAWKKRKARYNENIGN